jgi:hypothetical protein
LSAHVECKIRAVSRQFELGVSAYIPRKIWVLLKSIQLRDDRNMAKAQKAVRIRGKRAPAFGRDVVVVRTGRFEGTKSSTKRSEEARTLVGATAKALGRPGIKKSAVFKRGAVEVFAYSVDSGDPRRIVRRSGAGKRTIGRLVDGRFRSG